MRLGEAYSKCQHLAGTALLPAVAEELSVVYLSKGIQATTAIEGNTLSDEQVLGIVNGTQRLPPSQEYMGREILGILHAIGSVYQRAAETTEPFRVDPGWLKAVNRAVLDGVDVDDHVTPGRFTTTPVAVGGYRGAPPQDVPFLIDRLCEWLNEFLTTAGDESIPGDQRFVQTFFAAVLGHLYIAWIHPFGDGNGRTARLLEAAILVNSGVVPSISANLLSNHYNATRSRYYRRLAESTRSPGGVEWFLRYAANGLVDMLREQLTVVQRMQRRLAWESYIYDVFQGERPTDATRRRRLLALEIGKHQDAPVSRARIPDLTTALARLYAGKGPRTVARDVNVLGRLDLIVGDSRVGYRPNIGLMDAFVSPTRRPSGPSKRSQVLDEMTRQAVADGLYQDRAEDYAKALREARHELA
jgi:Fic family protein